MPSNPDQQPDPVEKSLGDQATGADVSRVDRDMSLGDQSTTGDALSSISDLSADLSDLSDGLGDEMPVVDLAERYEIQDVLGKGGMGEVLRALDTRLKRPVAIKRVLGEMARSKKALSRFLTEAQSVAALNHFNIVQIHDYGRDAEGPFIIMELVEGESLLDKLKAGPLEIEEAVDITCQLCDALGKAHGAGIIHRDIKPANILLTEEGTPKLTDFGLARQQTADHGQTRAGAVLGTIDFMPPEQRRDVTATDARSDLWSLAATLYQMITGEVPRVIDLDDVPQELRPTLSRALKSKQDDRYQTAQEFRDALQGSLETAGEPLPEVAVDLGAGECARCHTRNESSRKFCRGCGESLRISCLSCSADMPAWEDFCGDCGGNQKDLVSARRAELNAQREKAEALLKKLAFDESIRITREIATIEDSRLQQQAEWAVSFLTEIEAEQERQHQKAENHYIEAQKHREACDYKSAIQALETIPLALRLGEKNRYLCELQSDFRESQQLIRTIKARIGRRDLDGLQVQVDRAVELRGDREDLQKLQSQLANRQNKHYRTVPPPMTPPPMTGTRSEVVSNHETSRPPDNFTIVDVDRSKKKNPTFFVKWISCQGRVSRKEFWLGTLCQGFLLFLSLGFIDFLFFELTNDYEERYIQYGQRYSDLSRDGLSGQRAICLCFMAMDLCLFVYFNFCLMIQRAHDLNYSGDISWKTFWTFFKSWKMQYEMCFAPSHQGANQYGEQPD